MLFVAYKYYAKTKGRGLHVPSQIVEDEISEVVEFNEPEYAEDIEELETFLRNKLMDSFNFASVNVMLRNWKSVKGLLKPPSDTHPDKKVAGVPYETRGDAREVATALTSGGEEGSDFVTYKLDDGWYWEHINTNEPWVLLSKQEVNKLRRTISLLSSMAYGGEDHSPESIAAVREALHEILVD